MTIYMDQAPRLAGTVITLTATAILTYALRVHCRVTRKTWGREDWIMTGAVVVLCLPTVKCLTNVLLNSVHSLFS